MISGYWIKEKIKNNFELIHCLENNDYFVLFRVSAGNSTPLRLFNYKVIFKKLLQKLRESGKIGFPKGQPQWEAVLTLGLEETKCRNNVRVLCLGGVG